MSTASTKFASEAYADGEVQKEARIVRTAALIVLITSVPLAALVFIFSQSLVYWLNVPEALLSEASIALKISSGTFVISFLNTTLNTPQLVRLRMDLAAAVTSGARILGALAIPLILYLGGGIVGAISAILAVQLLTLAANILISGRLIGELFQITIDRKMLRPMLRFGSALAISGIAATLLVNLEKVVLARVTSVETLAYYSVAFTFASMSTMYSTAMIQSLFPAFSQLRHPDKLDQLKSLFGRALRMNILIMLPVLATLFVVARPLLTVWAGPDFGRESTLPFYILLVGLFFNIIAFIPHSLLMSAGKADVFASLYWIELLPYIFMVGSFTVLWGASGAALAWSLRCLADAMILCYLAFRLMSFRIKKDAGNLKGLVVAVVILIPSTFMTVFWATNPVPGIIFLPICLLAYAGFAWRLVLEETERLWFGRRLRGITAR